MPRKDLAGALRQYFRDASWGGDLNLELNASEFFGTAARNALPNFLGAPSDIANLLADPVANSYRNFRAVLGGRPIPDPLQNVLPLGSHHQKELYGRVPKTQNEMAGDLVSTLLPIPAGALMNTRAARNLGRVIKNTDALDAARSELSRVPSELERAVRVSPRGWVSPVELGTADSVRIPKDGRFIKKPNIVHTHPVDREGFNAISLQDKHPNSIGVIHAAPDGTLLPFEEMLTSGRALPDIVPGARYDLGEHVKFLRSLPEYRSNVPEDFYNAGAVALPAIQRGALGVIKNKGGNWLNGSVEDAVKGLKPSQAVSALDPRPDALNSFIDKQLTRYVKNEMATPEDPIRALAERGVLHFTPDPEDANFSMRLGRAAGNRRAAGRDLMNAGKEPLAQQWEVLADSTVSPRTAAEQIRAEYPHNAETMPWLNKLPGETIVYDVDRQFAGDPLNWRHLTDELSNALNPESGLPRHLLLDPASLPRVSVPQAVERVSQINAWRAEQARIADLEKMKANLAQKPHKGYEDGWRWVELPDADHPEGVKLVNDIGCQGGWCTQGEGAAKNYGSHASGNKLYALVDSEGRPHVQIQTAAPTVKKQLEVLSSFAPEEASRYKSLMLDENMMRKHRSDMYELGQDAGERAYFDKYLEDVALEPHELAQLNATAIRQIKPFSNSWDSQMVRDFTKKNPNYRKELEPMIQDFVKSGQWSDVGDLQNTGLRNVSMPEFGITGYHTPESLTSALTEVGVPEANISGHLRGAGFAQGGSVTQNKPLSVQDLEVIIGQIRQGTSHA